MDSRRDFLKKAAVLTGGIGISAGIPTPIQKAMIINPNPGTTFYDAEHIVFLMQENRSFDHFFGTLKGVRGFNDPRAKILPDQNKVWLQSDEKGNTFAPFRLDIKKTKITWQGGLAHDWLDQSGARNEGRHDKWIPFKSPMCMGYFTREDIPFYYALADAFTVCDHSFCSSLTGTTPNRLFFWTGTNRPNQTELSEAVVQNHQAESRYNTYVDWEAFPELLEDNAVSWKVYQNELWTPDLQDETNDEWLGNYGDNPLEYIKRYHVKLSAYFRKNGDTASEPPLSADQVLAKYNQLTQREKNLLDKAFTTNIDAPGDYLEMIPFSYKNEEGIEEEIRIPKNDIFHQFRKDVDNGKLPTVSWLVAPQKFSDHTDTPLYGTWYVSEAMDILTKNPEVWKKTIFIMTYDENDGYFDHISPFVPPKQDGFVNGKASDGIDTALDYEKKRGIPIGLGYRIPMIIASPWSKGGYVNSQVFDHTSSLMFLEKFLSHKTKKKIKSKNISPWRRTVCGDLTSAFRPYMKEKEELPVMLKKEGVITAIQNAKNKPLQNNTTPLTVKEIEFSNTSERNTSDSMYKLPQQEPGVKKACALPYRLFVDSDLNLRNNKVELFFHVHEEVFQGEVTVGSAFHVYTPKKYDYENGKSWPIAVSAGSTVTEEWNIDQFEGDIYDLHVTGPNGFFRRFKGNANDPLLKIKCYYQRTGLFKTRLNGNIVVEVENKYQEAKVINITDNGYNSGLTHQLKIEPVSGDKIEINLKESNGWYDFTISMDDHPVFLKQYAGHVETGKESITDPLMGGLL